MVAQAPMRGRRRGRALRAGWAAGLALLAAGLAVAAVAPRDGRDSRPLPNPDRTEPAPSPAGQEPAVAAPFVEGRAARDDMSASPAVRPPYFALPLRLRPRTAGAGWPGARADGAPPATPALRLTTGDWQADGSVEPRAAMVMPDLREPAPSPPGPPLPVVTGSIGDGPDRRRFLGEVLGQGSSDGDALRRWTPSHDPDPVPSRFVKGRPVPTRTPDVEFGVNPRTSLGIYGEITRPEKGDPLIGTGIAKPKEHGAGVTLQYKFGSQ